MGAAYVQPYAFGLFVLCGIGLGLVYCLLAGFRRAVLFRGLFTAALDILFWCIALIAFGGCLLLALEGQLRFFALMGTVIGFFLCYVGPGGILLGFCYHLTRGITQGLQRFGRKLRRVLEKSDEKG